MLYLLVIITIKANDQCSYPTANYFKWEINSSFILPIFELHCLKPTDPLLKFIFTPFIFEMFRELYDILKHPFSGCFKLILRVNADCSSKKETLSFRDAWKDLLLLKSSLKELSLSMKQNTSVQTHSSTLALKTLLPLTE